MNKTGGQRLFQNLIFLGIFFVSLVLPLRNGLPAFKDALPAASQTLGKNPLLAAARIITGLPPAYATRYADHYEGRMNRIELYNKVLYTLLDGRTFSNVLRGNDGWLFYTDEGNMDDYQNAHPFSPADLEEIGDKLASVQKRMDNEGILFLVAVAPNKETIYPEYLPDSIQKIGGRSRLDQLLGYLEDTGSHVNVLDLRPALLEKKDEYSLYYRTDSHWNDYGAYFACMEIITPIQKEFSLTGLPEIDDYQKEYGTVSGDLAQMVPMEPMLSEATIWLHPNPGPGATLIEKTDRVITISEVADPRLPGAIIFRDSFSNQLEPFLSENFSRAVYPWSFSLDWDLIEREQPDIVIYEIAERYLHLLKNITGK